LHASSFGAHVFDVASQFDEQQSPLFVQDCPTSLQTAASLIEASDSSPSVIAPSPVDPSSEPLLPSDVEPSVVTGPISAPSLPQPANTFSAPSVAASTANAPQGSFLIIVLRIGVARDSRLRASSSHAQQRCWERCRSTRKISKSLAFLCDRCADIAGDQMVNRMSPEEAISSRIAEFASGHRGQRRVRK
jgi:hypothetical protein